MNKVISYSIAICLLMIGGSFLYYYIIFLPGQQRMVIEREREEREFEKENDRIALNRCLSDAEALWVKQAQAISAKGNECASAGCVEAELKADAKIDKDLQQNKDNCFKQFPQ
mgnify:FL=1